MIKFGTDGWRAIIGQEFTFTNVTKVIHAYLVYLQKSGIASQGIVVGYDNRFLSEKFAQHASNIASAAGSNVYLTKSSVPAPAISFAVKNLKTAGAIFFTASHNPPEYNGFKIKAAYGGSASPEITKEVEKNLSRTSPPAPKPGKITTFDPKEKYLKHIEKLVDFSLIAKSGIEAVVDPMYGSGIGYLEEILKKYNIPVTEINNWRDPLFGGTNPEPIPRFLGKTISFIKKQKFTNPTTCIVLDGDADRVGGVDPTGRYISSQEIFTLLLKHLAENKKWTGEIVKTFNITEMVDKLCQKYKRKLHVCPIGFKYIAELMLKRDIMMGGEESGGMGFKNHLPERDGILSGLFLLEIMATYGKTLKEILDDIFEELGKHHYDRVDLHITEKEKKIVRVLKEKPPKSFAGLKIKEIQDLDGTKLIFADNSWLLFRASGTEPLLRIYAEAKSSEEVKKLLVEGGKLVKES